MKKRSKFTMKLMLILFALVPLTVGVICAVIMASIELDKNLTEEKLNTLRAACQGAKEYYELELEDSGEIIYNVSYVDSLEQEDVYLTVFEGNVRFVTSLKDESGKRIEGTTASDEVTQVVTVYGNDYSSEDAVINGEKYFAYYKPVREPSGKIYGMVFAGTPAADVSKAITSVIIKFVVAAALLTALFVVVVLVLSKIIATPIQRVADNLAKIADGDISERVDEKSHVNETLELLDAAQKLQGALVDIIGQTKDISIALGGDAESVSNLSTQSSEGANQIAAAMEDLAQGATGMAESVQNINEQAIEMGIAIEGISDNAADLIKSSDNIHAANADASNYIEKVSSSSIKSVKAVNNISEQISATNEAVDRIKDAVDMISSIASQTNLLALNASIEAARAGDAGRGFAVVATEIGSLSEQSDKSAKEIKMIVGEIVEKSEQSVALSEEVAQIITEEQSYIEETQNKFTVLNSEIEASLAGINSISQKIDSLETVKNEIIGAVQDLSAISEENAASNEEVSASVTGIVNAISEIARSSGDTSTRAQNLNETVAYFK